MWRSPILEGTSGSLADADGYDNSDDDPDNGPPRPAFASAGSGEAHRRAQTGYYPTSRAHAHGNSHGVTCPHCQCDRTVPSHLGRRIGSAVGTLAGAATATARTVGGAQLGAELGAVLGTPAGPAGSTVGAIAGAVLGAMVGAAAGCAIGAALGEAIDAKILHSHQCLVCGRGFSIENH